tara:strand:+ start:2126 stop:4891 length:2766 start_codon:yes stop_codon:yes gene_type:complete
MALTKLTEKIISDGLKASISGSDTAESSSFSSRVTLVEGGTTSKTLVSGSAQLAADISGSFSKEHLGAKVANVVTSSAQLADDISGSFGNQRVGTSDSPTFAGGTVTGDLAVGGTLTAQEVHTEFESASILFTSGSTIFGNSSDDIHNMTGSLNVSGALNLKDGDAVFGATATVETGLNLESGTFTVKNATSDSNGLKISQGGSDASNILNHYNGTLNLGVANSVDMTLKGGNVGIGTDNPQSEVHISGSGEVQLYIDAQGGNNGGIRLLEGGANKWTIANDQSNDSLFFYTFEGSAKRFVLDNNSRISLGNNDSGTNNTIFGNQAGDDIASGGNYNTIFGHNAGSKLTTGDASVFIGQGAGQVHVTGNRNIAIGHNSMVDTDAGSTSYASNDNLFIGTDAGGGTWTNTAIQQNVGIGNYSMDSALDEAQENTAVGYASLGSITTADRNTAIGYNAGTAINTGANNVIVGNAAGDAMTDNVSNVVIGKGALTAADSGENYNVVIGGDAGSAINNGSAVQNVIIGQDAGTGGTGIFRYNVAIGINALNSTDNNQVQEVVAVGRDAATKINSNDASGTVAIGSFALGELTSGQANTAIGWAAMYQNMDVGDFNTAVGYQCMYTFNPGSDGHGANTAVGYKAGFSNSTSENNTFMGARAGEDVTGGGNCIFGREAALDGTSMNNCVIIGSSAGSNASMTGDANIFIGTSAGDANTNGTNNIVIGAGSDGGATQDYQITIGSGFSNDGDDNSIQFVNGALSRRLSYDLDSGNATITSDERTKEDITDYQIGLEFINKLKPKQFTKKKNADLPAEFFGEYTESRNDTTKNPRVYQGMIAQEVSSSMVEMGITPTHITGSAASNPHFSGWEQSKESGEQRLSYVSFVTPLIQSVKELTDEIRFLRGAITGSTDLNQLKSLISSSAFV